MIRRIVALATAAVVAGSLAACAPSKPKQNDKNTGGGGVLRIATTTDIAHYNPLVGISATDFWINDLMYPTLLTMNSSGTMVASVATKWGYTSPTAGYYDLRSDMKWSDGTPLTAADVAWELNAIKRDQPPGIETAFLTNFASASAPSATRVELTLTRPDATVIPEVGFWMRIVPKHVFEKVGNIGKFANDSNWVSAGPYKLVNAVKGQSYTLDRVSPYPFAPGNTPTMSKVVFRVYPDVNTEILALKNGDVDVVANPLPPSQVSVLQNASGISVQKVPGLGYTFLSYNVKHKPLDNVLVRQALAYAVDNETLRKVVLAGQGESTGGVPITPVLKEWADPSFKEYPYDPNKSRQLLEQAGYHADSSGNFPLSFRLMYSLQDPVTSQMAPLLRDQAAKAGITLKLQGVDRNTSLQKAKDGDFDIYASSFSIEDNPIIGMQLAFQPGAANNYTFETDPELTGLLNQAQATTDQATQVSLAHQAAKIVQDKVYVNVLFMQNIAVAYRTGWSGFIVQPSQLLSIINPQSLANAKHSG